MTDLPFACAVVFLSVQSSSFSSITDSTMSLNIITVTLNMGTTFVYSYVGVQPRTRLEVLTVVFHT